MEISLIEATKEDDGHIVDIHMLGDILGVVKELCSVGEDTDLRNLRLVTKIATEEDSLETFLNQTFEIYNPELGQENISKEALEGVLSTVVFLTVKEAKEVMVNVTSEDEEVVSKNDLKDYLLNKKPNYVKVLKCWEGGLTGGLGDLLAMSASLTKEMNRRMEKVAES